MYYYYINQSFDNTPIYVNKERKIYCYFEYILAMASTTFLHHDYVSCLQYHPIDPHIFIAGSKNRVFSWDVRAPLQPVQNYAFKDYFGRVRSFIYQLVNVII